MRQIEVNSYAWLSLLDDIATNYSDGKLISHEWLNEKFGLKRLIIEDFETTEDFIKGLQMQQFSYMTLVDTLRFQLLESEKMYIKNVRGDGYTILNPKDQTQYGYDYLLKTVRQAIKEASLIMTNVRAVPIEQQYKDNDLRAKYSILKQMLSSIKP